MKLPKNFYLNEDVVALSKALLGKVLFTRIAGVVTAGKIVETEAYAGEIDRASHAYGGRYTDRTSIMYREGGVAYIYLCYGIHHLFNVVTAREGLPHAVLVRAIEPVEGIELMMQRRKKTTLAPTLTSGPGSLSQALGLTHHMTGTDLLGNVIWLEDKGIVVQENEIMASPRVGVSYAQEHADWPWRFRIKGNAWTSPSK